MAQLKKLQGEIDKGLKKIEEGVEEYNRLRDAHSRSSQPNQKEKIEENLKAQIKKLQRERNQLSGWIADKQVKDTSRLVEAKNKIEVLMDHFKDFERESKTKRFSQVGLNKGDRADPNELKRRELEQWIVDVLGTLEKEIDEFTATEQQLLGKKPSKNAKEEEVGFTQRMMEAHRWHMKKLDQLLRKLNNEEVDVESLEALKDSVECYMDEEQNSRTPELFQSFEDVYDDFRLEEVEDYLSKDNSKDHDEMEEKEEVKKEEPKAKEKPKAAPTISTRPVVEEKLPPPKSIPEPKQIATRPAMPQKPPAQPPLQPPAQVAQADPTPPAGPPPAKPPPAPEAHEPPAMPPPPPPTTPPAPPAGLAKAGARPEGPPPPPAEAPPVPQRAEPREPGEQLAYADIPPLTEAQDVALRLLEASGRFLPMPSDVRKPKRYSPATPYIHRDSKTGQPLYPMEPVRAFDDPTVFERYDVDTLFFIFYFQQGTYQQYLAAKELKKLAWRYHTKYLTWFQRHEEPRLTAPDFERGTYIFFDSECQWAQRLKPDFTFEYAWLESSEV